MGNLMKLKIITGKGIVILAVFILVLAALSACSDSLKGKDAFITINLNNSPNARFAAWDHIDDNWDIQIVNEILSYAEYHVTLKSSNDTQTHVIKNATAARFQVTTGIWQVSVSVLCEEMQFARSKPVSIDVKAGDDNIVPLTMEQGDFIFYAVKDAYEFESALSFASTTAIVPKGFVIMLTDNFSMEFCEISGDWFSSPITIIGNDRIITYEDNSDLGSLFYICDGADVTIIDLRLKGLGILDNDLDLNFALVIVEDAKFTMNGNSSISNSKCDSAGGGVGVDTGGEFIMNDGSITGNRAGTSGGGVFINGEGKFTMNGGTISTNNAISYGGGVYIETDGIFIMNGGTIAGNNAAVSGGGVYINSVSEFTMTGGTIYGSNETNASLRNSKSAIGGEGDALYVSSVNATAIIGGESAVTTDNTIRVINGKRQ